MSKYKREKQFMFSQKKINDVQLFLRDIRNLDISIIKDEKQNTVLHQCSYQGSLKIMQLYVDHMKKYWRERVRTREQVQVMLRTWVNQINKQGFTCLHYAAYKGWVQILVYLKKLGAKQDIQTNSGLGVLHLAAQGDKVKTFIYFSQEVDINVTDKKGSTPLHWAAFSGSEKVSEYLLAQSQIDLNSVDCQGQTPLHLATANGNTKIVRRLLLAGADRHIKNHEDLQPIQIARQNEFHNIQNFLNDNYTWLDYVKFFMNIKMKYTPRERSVKMPVLFHVSFLLTVVGYLSLGLNYYQEYLPVYYAQSGFFLILLILYWSLIVKPKQLIKGQYKNILGENPLPNATQGFVNSKSLISSGLSDSVLYHNDINSICLRCVQYKPNRSYHCDICMTCIQQYDHHCPWINNCVGKHNIFRFMLFLVMMIIALNWIFFICVHSFLVLIEEIDDDIRLFEFKNWVRDNQSVVYAYCVISTLMYLFFLIPLLILTCVQFINLLIGKTTYERFSKSNQSILSRSQADFVRKSSRRYVEKREKIQCRNCVIMCCKKSGGHERLLT